MVRPSLIRVHLIVEALTLFNFDSAVKFLPIAEIYCSSYARKNNCVSCTLGPAYNERKDAKETVYCKWVLVVTELFDIVSDF